MNRPRASCVRTHPPQRTLCASASPPSQTLRENENETYRTSNERKAHADASFLGDEKTSLSLPNMLVRRFGR